MTEQGLFSSSLQVVSGVDAADGGPSYSVPSLSAALRELGAQSKVLSVQGVSKSNSEYDLRFGQNYTNLPILRNMRNSRALKAYLIEKGPNVDVIHSHGFWLMPNVYAGRTAKKYSRSLIVSPRGMLSQPALTFSKYKKMAFWQAFQKSAYATTRVWHATSELEAQEIFEFGFTGPIAIIPNGVDLGHSDYSEPPDHDFKTILFLSRLHPKKGLMNLIDAWNLVSSRRKNWRVLIVGPSERGYREKLTRKIRATNAERVEICDPVYGEKKGSLYSSADLFVLPTQSENFGIVVAEALAHGIPVIVTNRAPWKGVAENRCGWWIDYGVDPLQRALLEATGSSDMQRKTMGDRGRNWVMSEFGWSRIAQDMNELYDWSVHGGERPKFVLVP